MSTAVYKNAKLVLPNEVVLGSVSAAEGLISSVDQGSAMDAEGWDMQGDYLMPVSYTHLTLPTKRIV